jgi:sulfur carrier protein
MTITVNGEPRSFADGATVARLVDDVAPSPKGVAVAVNGEVVPRSTWGGHALHDGDRVELLSAHQGG